MRKISEEGVALPVAGQRRQAAADARGQHADPARARQRHRDAVRRVHARTRSTGRITTEAEARALDGAEPALGARARRDEFARLENPNALFGIVQGGMFETLREESLAALVELDLPGYAIGGVSVGEPKEEMQRIVAHTPHRLPADKPRYLMGVGTPEDLVDGVAAGVDMFDCVMPTRNARNGHLFTRFGDLRIRNARYKQRRAAARSEPAPARPARASRAPTCTTSTAAARCSAPMLASVHNLHYYVEPDARGARRARGRRASPPSPRRSAPTARAASDARGRRTALTRAAVSRRQRRGMIASLTAALRGANLASPSAASRCPPRSDGDRHDQDRRHHDPQRRHRAARRHPAGRRQRMREMDVGSLPVLDGKALAGMVTDRDITVRGVADGMVPQEALRLRRDDRRGRAGAARPTTRSSR